MSSLLENANFSSFYLKNEEDEVLVNGKTFENDEGVGHCSVTSSGNLCKMMRE